MPRHRRHSIEFKRQVVAEYQAGESAHVLGRRHDLSRNLIDTPAELLLMELARECGLEAHRDAMFAGEAINNTEDRAVKHWLLRSPKGAIGDADLVEAVLQTVQHVGVVD